MLPSSNITSKTNRGDAVGETLGLRAGEGTGDTVGLIIGAGVGAAVSGVAGESWAGSWGGCG